MESIGGYHFESIIAVGSNEEIWTFVIAENPFQEKFEMILSLCFNQHSQVFLKQATFSTQISFSDVNLKVDSCDGLSWVSLCYLVQKLF